MCDLVVGPELPALRDRLGIALTPGGCGALRVGADLFALAQPGKPAYLSSPTWPNHFNLISGAACPSKRIPITIRYGTAWNRRPWRTASSAPPRAAWWCCRPPATIRLARTRGPLSGRSSSTSSNAARSFPFSTWPTRGWAPTRMPTLPACARHWRGCRKSWLPRRARKTSACTGNAPAPCCG